jgi:hypothetical protein
VESENVMSLGIELKPLLAQTSVRERERDQIPKRRGLVKMRREESEGKKKRV